jgi:hypothetical protein
MQARRLVWLLLAALAVAVRPHAGRADEPKTNEPKTLEQRVQELEQKVDQSNPLSTLGVSIHGLAAVDYLYDANRPAGSAPPFLRSFEDKSNSFILNLGNLHFERASKDGLGFVADVDFGETANVVNNSTYFGKGYDKNGNPQLGNGTDFFDARQFYLTYTVPVGSGIKLQVGRFVTLHGEEVIKSYNNLNYNITNSILFGFAIPFTHTGLMGSYAFNDQWTLNLGIVNGWDNVADNNDGKSVHGMLTYAPSSAFSVAISGIYGPEQSTHTATNPNNLDPVTGQPLPFVDSHGNPLIVHAGRSKRFLQTTVITAKPTDQLTLILDYDYGNEGDVVPRDGLLRTAQWQGAAGYIIYAFTDKLSAALRAEIFDDMDGMRTLAAGANGFGPGNQATYWEFTPTVTYKITDGLFWRNEYRHDESDSKKVFPRENLFVRGQDTLATEIVYTF